MSASSSKRERWIGLALLCVVTLAMLWLGEGALRLLRPDPAFEAIDAAERAGRPWDRRTRTEVVRDLREQGADAVSRAIPAALLEPADDGRYRARLALDGRELLPLAGISRKTVVLCNELGQYAVYESDEHGFRNPEGLWARAPVDVALIGDSFTLGECVPPGQTLGDHVRERHPATVNLGMGGHAPLLELGVLAEYGPVLRPRRVVWFYFENDLWWFDLGINARSPLLMRYLEPGFAQGLVGLQPEIDARLMELWASGGRDPVPSPAERMDELRGRGVGRALRFLSLAKLRATAGALLRPPPSPAEREPPDLALFERVLRRARDQAGSWGGEIVFVYLPGAWNFDAGPGFGSRDDGVRDAVLALAASLELPIVDAQAAMERHPEPLSLYSWPGTSVLGPPHLNGDGYAFVAGLVLEELGR